MLTLQPGREADNPDPMTEILPLWSGHHTQGTLPGEEDLGELEYTDSYTFRLVSRAGPLEDKSQVSDCP